jgi:DNA invertase Pin-like site-specific DNA recombinase
MLKRFFDPKLVYRVVVYLRMSSDQQNKRSPDQQLAEIKRVLKSLGYHWIIVEIFRDDAKTGRLIRNRKDYQRLMQGIKTGAINVDLILVDTLERLGRVEELPTIRKELYEKHGVLVLTADTGFADPNTPQGKALGMVEAMRATEHGRILGHNVLRGKRDAAEQGHWPGGPAPFGLKLENIMKDVKGRQEVDHSILVHDPETNWIMKLLLDKAYETSWGQTRLARFLNDHPDIPGKFKPFQAPSVGYWLDNPIYSGELLWEQNSTDIVDDARVVERNRPEDMLRVPNFCAPTVSRKQQEEIWAARRIRREAILAARARVEQNDGKLIEPPAPGMTLKYLATGLVRCGHCKRAMNPVSSALYLPKSGEAKRYTANSCPGSVAGVCPNCTHVPEEWLREVVVIGTVRQRLFPGFDGSVTEPDWLTPLIADVRQEVACVTTSEPRMAVAWEQELKGLQAKQSGWALSLANPDLNSSIRAMIESEWEKAIVRQQELEGLLADREHSQERLDETVDCQKVLDRLGRLPEVLALNNPTRANLELSLHIDRIDCFQDGKVVMRTCKLGALAGAVEMLARNDQSDSAQGATTADYSVCGTAQATPRRRARLRVDGGADVKAAVNTAADPNRFAGLDDRWFWEDVFEIPEKVWPFQEMAIKVAIQRLAGKTHEELAAEFSVTVPTIRKALAHAAETDERFRDMPQKMPRSRWHEDNALTVAAKKAEGLGTNELVAFFKKSDTTIRAALDHARKLSEEASSADDTA